MTLKSMKLHKTYQYKVYILTATMLKTKILLMISKEKIIKNYYFFILIKPTILTSSDMFSFKITR